MSGPSTYFAFGQTGTRSRGSFTAARNGDDVTITGTVTHGLYSPNNRSDEESFDFNPGQPGSFWGGVLESAGQAKPFGMRYSRDQDVTATLHRAPDGTLTLRSATWGPIR
ncbi:hypothetical protein [Paracraurococcus lichenis]|uniref:Uncharacterized protein n=1 Tax=Paracraurococcus lichenis TaxID=3064888 RepID=A0ABT9DZL2_9PROT|nr:hypothetical protein [Paracraurococcus sp. LOR1-02]MDO9709185.1 hypothetical protein [Paracraurococcus sp. LOR1-02]